ncbi:MAG TPA: PEP/pyruvate-binding domain-containing protein [Bryobacteraceae bacterium]|jgi:pyruvate,orthophosphate dikinase
MSLEVYEILPGAVPARAEIKEVGGKAWGLMKMAAAGLPVPAGFVLPTSWCRLLRGRWADDSAVKSSAMPDALARGIHRLEAATGLGFGSRRRPLLVSVRSGAAVSMPGMLETVLNVGLNAETAEGLIRCTGNPRLAWDSYRRLVQGYAEVVENLPALPFEELTAQSLAEAGVETEHELDYAALRGLTRAMICRFEELAGKPFPQDPREQLLRAAGAVFRSWDSPKAASYRRLNGMDNRGGTAVTVQCMVFGNAGGASGSGVGFTRNPSTGEPELYLDFQFNGQGEDVVAGRRNSHGEQHLQGKLPAVWDRLKALAQTLETLFRDAQDFEFTLQSGMLYLLQARSAKRTPWAALRIAVDLVRSGLLSPAEGIARLAGIDLGAVTRTRVAADADGRVPRPLAWAQVAGIGVASGPVALDSATAQRMCAAGTPPVLVRQATATEDIEGMARAAGILTATGGRTAHAAVVARQLGKVCLVGCRELEVDAARHSCRIGGCLVTEGEVVSLDGNSGAIYLGAIDVVTERPQRELAAIAAWSRAAAV